MTRAKDISKIITDADFSGTLDVTNRVTAGGITNSGTHVVESTSYFVGNAAQGYRFNNAADTTNLLVIKDSGNVGIGTSSPTNTLQVTGNIYATTTVRGNGGNSASSPNIAVDGGTGMFKPTGNTVAFSTANTERMRINSSGNVGIGTTSPSPASGSDTTLEIAGSSGPSLTINDTGQAEKYSLLANADDLKIYYGSTPMVSFQNDGNVGIGTSSPSTKVHIREADTTTALTIGNTTENTALEIRTHQDDKAVLRATDGTTARTMAFEVGTSEAMRINSSGNVGIGTTSLSTKFTVNGNMRMADNGVLDGGSSNAQIRLNNTSSYIGLETGNTERMRVDSSGNVGIGTGSPTQKLDVVGGSANIRVAESSGGDLRMNVSGSTGGIGTHSNHPLIFRTNSTERMRIDSSGNLLLQKTSATNSGGGTFFKVPTTPTTMPVYLHFCKTYSGQRDAIVLLHNGSGVGGITFNDTSTSFNTSSDHRLKENVTADWDATTRLKQLNPVRFNFIADADTTVDGFLAHEVQSVVPEAITGTHNEVDDDGNPVYQGIDQSKLVPLLVKTIQELEARIVALETA